MGRILYVFPHPDDESFGPGPAIARQRREGHEVHLLTLTRGEATSQREKLGYSKEEMAKVRYREMQAVADILDLSSLDVRELPDGELERLDPLDLQDIVREKVESVRPDVLATYYTHGISGHLDHLVTHSVVKQVFCELNRNGAGGARRLALFTLNDDASAARPDHLRGSPAGAIDCIVRFEDEDRRRAGSALQAYETYREIVEAHRPLDTVAEGVCFVLFQESFKPPLDDLFARLNIPVNRSGT